MDFPRDYDTKAFPESRSIAFARALAIWSSLAFVVIAVLCALFLWARSSMRLEPFIIAIDRDTGEWGVVSEQRGAIKPVAADMMIQESVVGQFAMLWFGISANPSENNVVWCQCVRDECAAPRSLRSTSTPCLLCCASGDELFAKFQRDILPEYRARASANEIWSLDPDSIILSSISSMTNYGGRWMVQATLRSNMNGVRQVLAYATVARANAGFPMSFGYYVSDFNAFVTDMKPFPVPVQIAEAAEDWDHHTNLE